MIEMDTIHQCVCESTIKIQATLEVRPGTWGNFIFDGFENQFFGRAVCSSDKCGLLYELDNDRFAAEYNEICERLMEDSE